MQSLNKPRLLVLSALLGGAAGIADDVAAQTCSCLPAFNTRSGGPASFFLSSTAHYRAYIESDQVYGFQTDAASPSVYVDFTTPGPGVIAQLCRLSYSGASVACASTATNNDAAGAFVDMGIPSAGLNALTNSQWDRYIADLTGGFGATDTWRFKGWSAMEPACG